MSEAKKPQVGEYIEHPDFGLGVILKNNRGSYTIRFNEGIDTRILVDYKVEQDCKLGVFKDKSFEDFLKDRNYMLLFPNYFDNYSSSWNFRNIISITSPLKNLYYAKVRGNKIYDVAIGYHDGILYSNCTCSNNKCCEHKYNVLQYLAKGKVKLDNISPSLFYISLKSNEEEYKNLLYLNDDLSENNIGSLIKLTNTMKNLEVRELASFFNSIDIDLEKSRYVQYLFANNQKIVNNIYNIDTYEKELMCPFFENVKDISLSSLGTLSERDRFIFDYVDGKYYFFEEFLENKEIMDFVAHHFDKFESTIIPIDKVYKYFAKHKLLKLATDQLDNDSRRSVYINYYSLFKEEGTADREINIDDYFAYINKSNFAGDKLKIAKEIFDKAINEGREAQIVAVLMEVIKDERDRLYYAKEVSILIKKLPDNTLLLATFKELLNDRSKYYY